MQNKNLLSIQKLSYSVDGISNIFEDVSITLKTCDKVGLVGRNGIGKSTLLKILSNEIELDSGTLQKNSRVHYVPQVCDVAKDTQLYEYIASFVDEWWLVFEKMQEIFHLTLSENAQVSQLSGGEQMIVNISIAFSTGAELVLLDEPTNHLDTRMRERLEFWLQHTAKSYVIASHDVSFLNKVTETTWELEDGRITVFGGNYDFYKQEKAKRLAAREQEYEAAQKDLRKAKASAQKETVRAVKSDKVSEKKRLPKIIANAWKDAAVKTAGRLKTMHDKRVEELHKKVSGLKADHNKRAYLGVEGTEGQKRSLLLEVKDASLEFSGSQKLLKDVDFRIYFGDRIALKGNNGSGKTSFVRALLNSSSPRKKYPRLNPEPKAKSELQTAYIDQNYNLLKKEKTILDNFESDSTGISYEKIREQLARFLFLTSLDVSKSVSALSGGEMARLCFAIVTARPIDLLILDEPSNNLDIETKESIIKGLKSFSGALLLISHDQDFTDQLGLTSTYEIQDDALCKV